MNLAGWSRLDRGFNWGVKSLMMMMFDEMGCGGDVIMSYICPQQVTLQKSEVDGNGGEDDYNDKELDVDELERRMWRDKMRLKKLKEQTTSIFKDGNDVVKSQEQARRKKMSRVQNGILKIHVEDDGGLQGSRFSLWDYTGEWEAGDWSV